VWRLRAYAGERRSKKDPTKTVPVQVRETFKGSERDADKALAKLVAKVDRTKLTTSTTETVGDLLTRWIDQCEAWGYSPETTRKYRSMAENVLRPKLGNVKLSKLTAEHLDRLYNELSTIGMKPTTIRKHHNLMSGALSQAVKWRLVSYNEAKLATPPRDSRAEVIDVPSPAEVLAMVAAADSLDDPTQATVVYLLAHTGARRGEVCALRWTDVDFDNDALTIARSLDVQPGQHWTEKDTKNHQVRVVYLGVGCVARLRQHQDLVGDVPPDGFVFSRTDGADPINPTTVSKFVTKVAKKANVKAHTHSLRHAAATQAIAAGYDVVTVAGRLGHADPSVTLRVYSHQVAERSKELAAALDLEEAKTSANPVVAISNALTIGGLVGTASSVRAEG
jgi:integrase